MGRKTKHLIIVSFDGLSTLDFDYINKLPNFKEFIQDSSYCKNVYSVYPSLTYPAHTSIVTGKYPNNHGVINNTFLQLNTASPDWYWHRKSIKSETFYDIAIQKGMKVAALLWPVTAKSKIQYNMPEIFANRKWENQIIVSLLNGSPIYQLSMNFKYGNIRKGKSQPELDNFTSSCLNYTLENKKPDVTMVHFTDLDTIRHNFGFYSKEAKDALKRHDNRLGKIINTLKKSNMYDESTIILLGDHSSLNEDKIICINKLFKDNGLIEVDNIGNIKSWKAILKNCDGSAYIYINNDDSQVKEKVLNVLNKFNDKYNCIEDIFSSSQAKELGADENCSFMLEAKEGYYFLDNHDRNVIEHIDKNDVGQVPHVTLSTHGYSPFKENYTTVFMAKGKGIKKNIILENMNLIDYANTFSKLLGFRMENIDGRTLDEIIN
ncbi:ectonucleotide pyrophosphatase/phosphodiesterase [Senegalia massiliensis]|uniref:alkaline phosphatase family protein n=1 Tax=Senegalia massiliensis TaxID=1720316 RepID=UPI001031A077|nr:ectonucleotide pyrophosphatase/phosphodiesterase [Senegalia massiliensis]